MKVTLPPEVIEAQLRHLAATTEANLRAYHARVAAAQVGGGGGGVSVARSRLSCTDAAPLVALCTSRAFLTHTHT